MERLEKKIIKGHEYYYYSRWAWVEGRCRRVWQKYLGKLEDIGRRADSDVVAPVCAEVFECGLPSALWNECRLAQVIEEIDRVVPKRAQGLSTGEYIAIATINRAISPCSKRSIWEWFSGTTLIRKFVHAKEGALSSQRFWDHMKKISKESVSLIWKQIITKVIKRENIDISSISYDGTNFYTFIDTFNARCEIAKRGKNKQGRTNLRQVSYALFCSADGHIPLFFEAYAGNRNDAKQFPIMLKNFAEFFKELGGGKSPVPDVTLIFDKGNNSEDNFALLDSLPIHYVGSVKLDEQKGLAEISNKDARFIQCSQVDLAEAKAFKVTKEVYGKTRTLVVTYNENLFDAQWATLKSDIGKAERELETLRTRLSDRASGVIKGGKSPSLESVKKQCAEILSRQYLKELIKFDVEMGTNNIPMLSYSNNAQALDKLTDTYLGKNILITDRESWTLEQVITAYRSQYIIENVFKEMKDRVTGYWWPMFHWTDSQIHVHGLYCTIALLLRALMARRVARAGIKLSMQRLVQQLDGIREVVNIYPTKKGKGNKKPPTHTVLTKTSDQQKKLVSILGLQHEIPCA